MDPIALAEPGAAPSFDQRRRTADRIFRGALAFNAALTAFWLFVVLTRSNAVFFSAYDVNVEALDWSEVVSG